MSIATKTGDGGTTGLIGGTRVSKTDLRVEAYGTLDELGACIGFARSITPPGEVRSIAETLQRELFAVCSVVARDEDARGGDSPVTQEMLVTLDGHVRRIEAMDGIVGDWALPGELPCAAAFDVARTVCRRAERCLVRLRETGLFDDAAVMTYINRLSDVLWLLGRQLEVEHGVQSRLREGDSGGPAWSRAW